MAKTIEQLKAQSAEVKNATVVGENTATRVGTLFNDIVEHVEEAEQAIIYDVSARNNGTVFESISALLNNSNLDTLIPVSFRHGGMTIRFIQGSEQSSDNKYVQYRLISNTFNTVEGNWLSIDKTRFYSLPFFTVESDFDNYNNIRIYDIKASAPIPEDYPEIQLCSVGVESKNGKAVITIIKKDGDVHIGSDYLAELYVDSDTISDTPDIQVLKVPHVGSGTIDFYITINISDLKNIVKSAPSDPHKIYIDKNYINNNFSKYFKTMPLIDKGYDSVVSCDIYLDAEILNQNENPWHLSSLMYFEDSHVLSCGISRLDNNNKYELYYIDKSGVSLNDLKGIVTFVFGLSQERLIHYYDKGNGSYIEKEVDNVARFVIKLDISKYKPINVLPQSTSIGETAQLQNINYFAALGNVEFANKHAAIDRFFSQLNGKLTGEYVMRTEISIEMNDNQKLYGDDCKIKVLGSTGKIVMNNESSLQGITFYGDWNVPHNIDESKECGISSYYTMDDLYNLPSNEGTMINNGIIKTVADKTENASIINCVFKNVDRLAIDIMSESHRSSNHPYISNCYFIECNSAVWVRGEFVKITGCHIENCLLGIVVKSGNSNIAQCIFRRCDSALYMYDGGNGLHGEFISNHIAHCPLNGIYIKSGAINLGHLFIGCHVADAGIEGDVVNSMMFSGCRFETWFNFKSGAKNSILNSIFTKAYSNMYGKVLFEVPEDTNMKNNRLMSYGGNDAEVNN